MASHNGGLARIQRIVQDRPGLRLAELALAADVPPSSGLMAYARKVGLVHVAGPRGFQRYYPTVEMAAENDAAVHEEAKQSRLEVKRRAWRDSALRRKAATKAAGRSKNTRPGEEIKGQAYGTFTVRGKRFTIAPPPPPPGDRFASQDAPATIDASQARPWAAAVAERIGGAS